MVLYLSLKLLKTKFPVDIERRIVRNIEGGRYSRVLLRYLYNQKENTIQTKSSRLYRLFIELYSDNTGVGKAVIKRLMYIKEILT